MSRETHLIIYRPDSVSIKCLVCGRESFNAIDVQNKWCGNCSQFHPIPELKKEDHSIISKIGKALTRLGELLK